MAANAREARRQKILGRGSDRLALITGQIQSLPSSSEPLISNDQHLQLHVVDQSTVSQDTDKLVDSASQHRDTQIDARSSTHDRDGSAPLFGKHSVSEAAVSCASKDGKDQSPLVPSESQDSSLSASDRDQYHKPQVPPLSSLSLNQLSSAISQSEKTRLCCSAAIAILVVLSHIGFPFVGQSFMRTIFGFRPLYLVLLTNASVVLGRLFFTKQKGYRVPARGESQVTPSEEHSSAEQISRVLEAAFRIQKVMDAIFMDCSVFLVIVVSGLSFVQ